jgi:hypothetical protein
MEYIIIFNVSEINKVDFTKVLETDQTTLRLSVDQTKTFVTWNDNNEPSFVSTLTTKEGPYDYPQAINILGTPEWYINPFIV